MIERAPVAVLTDVCHRYGRIEALRSVDLTIPAGAVTAFVGPDGVGKSTLLGLLAGTKRIQVGAINVLGADLRRPAERARIGRDVAYMPQGLGQNLYADLSIRENIAFFARLFGLARERTGQRMATLLAVTGLSPFAGRRVRHLSGGMKQKLGLCCALIHEPKLVVLDEPTTGVDPLSRRQFWDLVDGMHAQSPDITILVATAYMDEAARFPRIVMLDDGRILADGSPAVLLDQTGTSSLEEAYAALLPEAKRTGHAPFTVAPRTHGVGEVAIAAENLTRQFDSFVAVDHADFRVERGEIFGFVGPNGCGKTTTMKMLTGLLPPSQGEARLFGRLVDAADLGTRKRLGYMSQAFSLYRDLTVRRNLTLHGHLFDMTRERLAERIGELSALLDLSSVLDRRAETLPLGIRQRLSLAVALIHEPDVLILDEPTSGVDPVARNRFWRTIAGLARERGVTIFVSTHYLSEAARCDRIALMNAGRVLAVEAPEILVRSAGASSLEEAFIALIERDIADRSMTGRPAA